MLLAMAVNILETERLWLRPFAHEDVDALHRLWTDPDVRRYLWDDKIIDRERAAAEVDDSIASFARHGFGMWVVMLAGATEITGFAGLRRFGSPPANKELMYGVAPHLWGRGYATELARALLRFGFEQLGEQRIWARTDPPNVASMRVMAKAGMTLIGREREGDLEVVTYVKDRTDPADRSDGVDPGDQ